jgi:CRP-like cAMP-binding protein
LAGGDSPSPLSVLAGLTAAEREIVGRTLERRVYQRGDIVIKEGDTDRSLFMISKGTASVKVSLAGQAREKRLASFSPGAVFGEWRCWTRSRGRRP